MEEKIELLKQLHAKLKECYLRDSKEKASDSLLLALLNLKSTTRRMRILIDASIPSSSIRKDLLEELIRAELVQFIERRKRLTFTTKGIWEIESFLNLVNNELLLRFIDKKWFNCFEKEKQSLNEKEKVILFTTLAVRAFSEESSVDLTKGQKVHDAWKEAVEETVDFLCDNKIISDRNLKTNLFIGKSGKTSLHPVIHCFRYSAEIPPKTNGIYIAKNLKYFLNLYRDAKIDIDELTFLFELVFENNFEVKMLQNVYEFCRSLSYEKNVSVFLVDKHIFAQPDYDDLIKVSLRNLLINSAI